LASANLLVRLFALFWKRSNTVGAVVGMTTGLASSIPLIGMGSSLLREAVLFPLKRPVP